MKFIVYKTTNMVNKKFYIGVHKTKTPDVFDGYYGSGTILKKAILKYGKENFIRKTLFIFDDQYSAFLKEKEIVNETMVKNNNCYNKCVGGHGGDKISLLAKKEREKIKLKKSLSNIGRKDSDETKYKKSKSSKIRIKHFPNTLPCNKNRKHTGKSLENIQNSVNMYHKDTCFISNGSIEFKIKNKTFWVLEKGWYYGRTQKLKHMAKLFRHSEQAKNKIKDATTGVICYNNGTINMKLKYGENPPEGFKKGMIKRVKNIWITNGKETKMIKTTETIPSGFIRGKIFKGND